MLLSLLVKKLYSIFLLTIFFVSSNGYWIMNQLNYLQMKEKVEKMKKDGLHENDLQQFTFTDEEFSNLIFHDDGEEMELEGKMYDIVKIKKNCGKNIICCLTDAKETQLKLLAKKHQQQRNLRYKNTLAKVYIPSRNSITLFTETDKKNMYASSLHCGRTCSISYEILKPPPETVL